ncbi:MAG: PAS domain S-box protein [Betaproteobacteria bacterium]|nr:PAS domain S-box protein [Betaproteobacteria bacterium]
MTQVLIVEDHEENRTLLKMLLEANGYRVTAAGDGVEALAAARRDPPDAIVSDVLMPKMDGFALCRQWMQDARLKAIPFIFYSATYVRPENEQFGLALGAVRYLIKPLEAEVFLRELGAVLQQWAGRAAPGPAAPLDDATSHALHESALARKVEDKIAQLEAANRELVESEARFRSLTEMSSDLYWESDAEHRLTQRTSAGRKSSTASVFARTAQIGERRWDIAYLSPDAAGWAAHRAVLDAHQPFCEFEFSRLGADGTEKFISINGDPVFDTSGAFTGYRGVGIDITKRRRAEQALRESEERLRAMFDGALDGILVADVETHKFLTGNPEICRMLGCRLDELARMGIPEIHRKQDLPRAMEQFERLVRGEIQLAADIPIMRKDGSVFYADIKAARIRLGGQDAMLGIFRDVSERKQAERALVDSEQRFRSLVEQSLVGIYVSDGERIVYTNPRAEEILGYEPGELAGASLTALIADEDQPAVEREIRSLLTGEVPIARLEIRARRKDGSEVTIGAQGLRARVDNRPAIVGVLQDISEKKRAEEQIQRYVAQLENAFMSTVRVVTTLGELRDPYTAGHQRRVAEIALAIGAEFGFDARRQEGLRVAGYLHDIGKLSIPSEILSKPGKLSPIEFQMVQGHAQASYDVLKEVEFPWPVAEVALQHHERMDGSGYPQGLKGEAILIESRIMAVANVIDAMCSHRPYRAGLGIDAVLSEIERGRGSLYDAEVADACLRLFRERRYQAPA